MVLQTTGTKFFASVACTRISKALDSMSDMLSLTHLPWMLGTDQPPLIDKVMGSMGVLESDLGMFLSPAMNGLVALAMSTYFSDPQASLCAWGVVTVTLVGRTGVGARRSTHLKCNGGWVTNSTKTGSNYTLSLLYPQHLVLHPIYALLNTFLLFCKHYLQVYTNICVEGYRYNQQEKNPMTMDGAWLSKCEDLHGLEC